MQINYLLLHNFKQYQDAEIKFPEGLTGFIGKNGAGKSTIFEAIYLALYGKFDPGKEKMKNDYAAESENVKVELEFEDKGVVYKIVREFRGKSFTAKAEIFKDGNSVATGSREVTREVQKALKIDATNFKNSFFSQQKEVTALLSMPAKDRQLQFRKMLGLSKLDTLEERVKEKAKNLGMQLKGKGSNLYTEEQIGEREKKVKGYEAEEEISSAKKSMAEEKHRKTISEYDEIKMSLSSAEKIKEAYEKLDKNKNIAEAALSNYDNNIVKVSAEIEGLRKNIIRYNELLPKKEQYTAAQKEIECLQELKNKMEQKSSCEKMIQQYGISLEKETSEKNETESERDSLRGCEKGLKDAEIMRKTLGEMLKELNKTKDLMSEIIGSLNGQSAKNKERQDQIKLQGKESPCPDCERPLGEHYEFLLEKYELQNKSLDEEAEQNKKKLELQEIKIEENELNLGVIDKEIFQFKNDIKKEKIINEKIGKIGKSIEGIERNVVAQKEMLLSLGEVIFNEKELLGKLKERDQLKGSYDEALKLEASAPLLKKKETELNAQEVLKKEKEAQLVVISEEIERLNFKQSQFDQLKEQRDRKEAEFNETKDEKNECEKEYREIVTNKRRISDELKKNAGLVKEAEEIKVQVELHGRLAMFVNEFKSRLTSRELPAISGEASRLFGKITKDRYSDLQITKEFDLRVTRDSSAVDLDTLSGGEKDLASLCLRIAISKRVSALAGRTNMGFLALDEVFSSQDEDRRDELLNSLLEISKDFRQIFVVSHNQDVQEAFSNRLEVKKVGNFSKVEIVVN
ncbi:MAG: SMC family ATPase [Ignavibacteria bacterium]